MQFTGHSLPVHQSMSVPWDFYLVPFFQPSPPTRFLLITAIGMCHFLPVHHFGMACLAGSKVNIQHNECPGYDTKQTDGETSVLLRLWGMQSTPSLPLLLGPLWSEVIVPEKVLSMGQIITLNWIIWKEQFLHLTVCKQKLCTYAKRNCLKQYCLYV